MGRLTVPIAGPYGKWVSGFLGVSDRAFDLLRATSQPEVTDTQSRSRRVIFDLSLHAETTSIAARTALTYSLCVPAFALARVRLEQCIVASFLVHAPETDGIGAYLRHHPIQVYEITRKHEKYFNVGADLESLRKQAVDAQEGLSQGEVRDGKFMRRWTSLSLSQLAEQRDIVASAHSLLPWKLQDVYWSFYPLASLAVHGASETVFWAGDFHEPSLGSRERFMYTLPARARAAASVIAKLDVVQCFEALSYFGVADATDVGELLRAYDDEYRRDA